MDMEKDGLAGKTYQRNCNQCQKPYKGYGKYFCSNECRHKSLKGKPSSNKGKPMSEDQKKLISKIRIEKGIAKGEKNPRWGKSKYKTIEEKQKAKLDSGRKSYRKNIKTRSFYYRQLAHKRRGTIGTHSKEQWEEIKKKNNYCCMLCGMQEPFTEQQYQKLTEDHVIPISKGGTNNIDNIQPLCKSCNSRKRDN